MNSTNVQENGAVFRLVSTDRDQLSRLLNISPETMMYVTNASAGSGLIFADEYGAIPLENKFPSNTNLYRIISTKFGEDLNQMKQERNS